MYCMSSQTSREVGAAVPCNSGMPAAMWERWYQFRDRSSIYRPIINLLNAWSAAPHVDMPLSHGSEQAV